MDIEVATTGVYTAEVVAWSIGYDERYGDDGYARLGVTANAYEEGDTWYRDMRIPGFGDRSWHPKSVDSLQWLARKIVADPRFAEATVKFWWPAIMGSEVAEPPAEAGDADFEGQLLAANCPGRGGAAAGCKGSGRASIDARATTSRTSWSRWCSPSGSGRMRSALRTRCARSALRDAGARRLLTPEELAHKTDALTGSQWGRYIIAHRLRTKL